MVFIIVVENKLGHTATKPINNAVDSMLTTDFTITERDKGPCTIHFKGEKKAKEVCFLYRFPVKNSMFSRLHGPIVFSLLLINTISWMLI